MAMNEAATTLPARASALRRQRPTFAAVADRYLDDVHAYLLYLVGDRGVADDLTGETFERALRAWRRYDPRRGSPRTWLCQIARTAALDYLRAESRRRRREERYAVEADEVVEAPLVEGLSPGLEQALRSLSAGEREVIALRVVLELSAEEAARLLGISTTACTTRLSRALKNLQASLEQADV
jgi:RNA polymerase sigma-70 factor, ECF subfamily